MYQNRCLDYVKLEEIYGTKLLVYVTSDRPGLATQVSSDVLDYFVNHLDLLGKVPKISLFLYTRGGDTLAGWSIINLIRQFCEELEIIVPSKCHSTGTLMCLGANNIVMTKQATLGPIDPSINTALNPIIPGGNPNAKYPVSVEAIKGYLSWAKDELRITTDEDLTSVLLKLTESVHPLVLGEVYRAKSQIQMLAGKLLSQQVTNEEQINKIISFLVSDSGSHDYTIYRREARDYLGLNITKPDDEYYNIIKKIYDDISDELELTKPLDPEGLLGNNGQVRYIHKRGLIESVFGGSHSFISEGELIKHVMPQMIQGPNGLQQVGSQQVAIEDKRKFEGWRHEYVRDNNI